MFVFIWSSRRSRLRALPQDLRIRPFSVWFCAKHLHFALKGQGMPCEASPHTTGHGQRPPAGVLLPSAIYIAGRHFLLPVGTPFCQNGTFGRPTTVHLLLQIFCHSCLAFDSPPYTCMEGSPSLEACLVSFTRQEAL